MDHPVNRPGFTIVELLIVIVVIGVLAAIVIVAYSGVQNRASDASVQSDLRALAGKTSAFQATDPTSSYPHATQADLQAFVRVSKNSYNIGSSGSLSYCRSDTGYTFMGRSKSKQSYVYSLRDGLKSVTSTGGLDDQCALGGINATDAGYENIWLMYGTAYPTPGWQTWIP